MRQAETRELKRARQLCTKWQAILGLNDWHVQIEIKPQHELSNVNAFGEISWSIDSKCAWMFLISESQYGLQPPFVSFEGTIVHELLHLHLAPIDNFDVGTLQNSMLEQAIHSIERALMALQAT